MFNLFAALRAADFLFTISRSATQSYLSGRQISINSDTLKTLFKEDLGSTHSNGRAINKSQSGFLFRLLLLNVNIVLKDLIIMLTSLTDSSNVTKLIRF